MLLSIAQDCMNRVPFYHCKGNNSYKNIQECLNLGLNPECANGLFTSRSGLGPTQKCNGIKFVNIIF